MWVEVSLLFKDMFYFYFYDVRKSFEVFMFYIKDIKFVMVINDDKVIVIVKDGEIYFYVCGNVYLFNMVGYDVYIYFDRLFY